MAIISANPERRDVIELLLHVVNVDGTELRPLARLVEFSGSNPFDALLAVPPFLVAWQPR